MLGVDAAAAPAQWIEYAKHASRLTSLVVDPPDGSIPPLTPEGEKRRAAQPQYYNMRPASWEDMTCMTAASRAASPRLLPGHLRKRLGNHPDAGYGRDPL